MRTRTIRRMHEAQLKKDMRFLDKKNIPSEISMTCDAQLDICAAAVEENSLPTFKMLAYNGGVMLQPFGRVVIDLAKLKFSPVTPILYAHSSYEPIAHTTAIEIKDNKIYADGIVSGEDETARRVVSLSKNGFPFQASVGVQIGQAKFIEKGESMTVNGKSVAGPVYVVTKGILKEISVVVHGADDKTKTQIAATNFTQEINMEFKEWLKAKGIEAEDCTEVILAELQEKYDLEVKAEEEKPEPEKVKAKEPKDELAEIRDELKAIKAMRNKEIKEERTPVAPNVIVAENKIGTDVLEAALCMSAGIPEKGFAEKTLDVAHKNFKSAGLKDIMAAAARSEGIRLPDNSRSSEWIRAAISTTSLSGILGNTANKAMLAMYEAVPSVVNTLCNISQAPDFKTKSTYRLTENMEFEEVGPTGELKHGTLDEQTYTNRVKRHGKFFSLSDQMIINDDLGAFLMVPRALGVGAARAKEKAFFTLLLGNTGSFFASGNSNYNTGTATALGITSLGTATTTLEKQTDGNGNPINAMGRYVLVPTTLKVSAMEILESPVLITGEDATRGAKNIFAGKYQLLSSPWLETSTLTGYSAAAWYLFADPMVLPAVEVAYLNGNQAPTIENVSIQPDVLGIGYRGYFDFGFGFVDPRGAVKMKGEA